MHSPARDEFGVVVGLITANRLAEAEARARELVEADPGAGIAWKVLGVALARQGKDALPALQRGAALLPQDAEAHSNLGSALHAAGRHAEALTSLRRALQLQPRDLGALVEAAGSLQALGQLADAVTLYQEALRLDRRQPEVLNNLGNTLVGLGQYREAQSAYGFALELAPGDARIHCNRANALRRAGEYSAAIGACQQALALEPGLAPAHHTLGLALLAEGRVAEALASLREAAARDPGNVEYLNHLGSALLQAGALAEAVSCFERALALRPDSVAAQLGVAGLCRLRHEPAEAESRCRAALALRPDHPEALCLLGELCADRGDFTAAGKLFDRALAVNPSYPAVYWNIAAQRRLSAADATWRAGAEALLARPQALGDAISLHYALGKYCDDTGAYAQAFAHFRAANELSRRHGAPYDGAKLVRRVDELIAGFSGATDAAAAAGAADDERLVFVVGMPRSGTSLTEQILAAHPAVRGVGEIVFWEAAHAAWTAADPAARGALAATLARDYLQRVGGAGGGALRIVDKMPANYLYLGLIHRVFPRARFVHVHRDPVDTGLSIYQQHFARMGPWSHDLATIAHFYRQYLRIMAHWRTVLPPSSLFELPYEALVADPDDWTRRLTGFAGLPWDPRCLEFHRIPRVVITASRWQVRQPLNAASIGRSRPYESHLGALVALRESR